MPWTSRTLEGAIIESRTVASFLVGRETLEGLMAEKAALVCGAGGFIGSHLVKALKKEGYWVRGVDLKFPEFSETAADDFVVADPRHRRQLTDCAWRGNRPLAAAVGFDDKDGCRIAAAEQRRFRDGDPAAVR